MLKTNLVALVRDLDHNFKWYPRVSSFTNASLWYIYNNGCAQQLVCAVPDENDIPEYSMMQKDEFIKHRGWRAILRIISELIINGHRIVNRAHFWKVLAKHGIYNILQARQWETDVGTWHTKQTAKFDDYRRERISNG